MDASYRNYEHYITTGWAKEPKESFKALFGLLQALGIPSAGRALDVGCATGELLGFLHAVLPDYDLAGVDIFDDLLVEAGRLLPKAQFVNASALELPESMSDQFDVVTAIGCMSIFDENDVETFWDSLLGATKPGGWVVVLSPLNEFGVDLITRHRKRRDGIPLDWETGWNIFSIDSINELLAARGIAPRIEPFRIGIDLAPQDDPVRTWTMQTASRERQLTNGLKLLVDHYFMCAQKPSA